VERSKHCICISLFLTSIAFLSSPRSFETDSVYTFDFYQHILVPSDYSINMSVAKVSLAKILDGQPLQCMARERGGRGRSLWNFQLWHEKLLD